MKKESLIAVLAVLAVALTCVTLMAEDTEADTSETIMVDGDPVADLQEDESGDDSQQLDKGAEYYIYGDLAKIWRTDGKIAIWRASIEGPDGEWNVIQTFVGYTLEIELTDYDYVKVTRTWPGESTVINYLIPLHMSQSGDSDMKYVVTFYDRDTVVGSPYVDESTMILKGEPHVMVPDDPVRDGYVFGGWFTDPSCEEQYRFDPTQPIPSDMSVYAKWDGSGGSGFPWWIIIVVIVVIAAIIAIYVYKNNKNRQTGSS